MATTDLTRPTEQETAPRPSRLQQLKDHARDPMSRSGYALVLGSAITSALGMGFWVLAARLYDARDVGTTSALIAAMGFLGSASTIGLKNGFIRFLPVLGGSAARFIRNAYLACITVAVVASLVFVAGQPVWAGELALLREGPAQITFFVVATAAWTLFVLQDSVLTGLRMASWVPAENTVFAVAKLGLLVALVAMPRWGIFVAWSIPAIVLLLPVNVLIFRAVRKRGTESAPAEGIALPDVMRFAAGDHVAAFLWLGTTELLSLVVLARAGAEEAAFYFLSFQVAYSLYLVTSSVASAFVVEAAVHSDREVELLRRALLQAARLVVPGALVAAALAPWILRVIGSEYEASAVPLLRLLLLSAIPQVVVGMSVGRARLHRHVRIVILVYLVTAVALFTGATVGLSAGGLDAVGWAWLGTQTLLALVLIPTVLHPPIGRKVVSSVIGRLGRVRARSRQRGRSRNARAVMPAVLRAVGADGTTKYTLLGSYHDAIVARATIDGDPVVVRVAMSEAGRSSLTGNADVLERLGRHTALRRWGAVVPSLLERTEVDGRTVVVESFLPGTPLDRLEGEERTQAVRRASESIAALHRATARRARFSEQVARRWIDGPVKRLAGTDATQGRSEEIARLRDWLRDEMVDREMSLCWVHGDFWAGNVLVAKRGGTHRVTALFDWENGRRDGFGALDLAHMWLSEQPGEIGQSLLAAIQDPTSWEETRAEDDGTLVAGSSGIPVRVVLVLAWLNHIGDGLARSSDHAPSRVWMRRNVLSVLDRIDELVTAPPGDVSDREDHERGPEESDRDASVAEPEVAEPEVAEPKVAEPDADTLDDPTPQVGAQLARRTPLPAYFSTRDDDVDEPTPPAPKAERSRRVQRLTRADVLSLGVIALATAAWVVGLWGADPREMADLGLVSLMTPAMAGGLALLSVGFVLALRRHAPGWVVGLHIVVLILLLHGTPAVLYDTLRYSWAWKHTGIVEFIMRTGAVDTTVGVTPIYHAWPGFFAASALLTEFVGAPSSIRIAMWAPAAFNLFNLFALRYLLRTLSGNRQTVWLALWFFFVTNWVGQDYFSPQAMAYLLYLVMVGTALRGFRFHTPKTPALAGLISTRGALPALVVMIFAIASSHQITPFLAMVVLAGLTAFGQIRGWYLPVIAGLAMTVWAGTVGSGELRHNARSLVDSFGRPISNAEETLQKSADLADSQVLVSQAGRAVVLLIALVAVVGLVRMWRHRSLDRAALVIAATPAALPFATEFGGEAIFRVFLFAIPAVALLAAGAINPHPTDEPSTARWSGRRTLVTIGLSVALLAGYTTAYYGKEGMYFFTKGEIAAMTWIAQHAEENTLLVEGSRNYPSQFIRYDWFTYVAINREPADSQERVLADPVGRLADWLDNDDYAETFLLITRSQKNDIELNGGMPPGSLERIEDLLLASDKFEVAFRNEDATVFQLAGAGGS